MYQDDLSLDVKDDFKSKYNAGETVESITSQVCGTSNPAKPIILFLDMEKFTQIAWGMDCIKLPMVIIALQP